MIGCSIVVGLKEYVDSVASNYRNDNYFNRGRLSRGLQYFTHDSQRLLPAFSDFGGALSHFLLRSVQAAIREVPDVSYYFFQK
jgi:hypothetical protein